MRGGREPRIMIYHILYTGGTIKNNVSDNIYLLIKKLILIVMWGRIRSRYG